MVPREGRLRLLRYAAPPTGGIVNRYALVLCLLAASCAAPTAADKGRAIQGVFTANRAACLMLIADPAIPRDQSAMEYCARVLVGCPKAEP
jgi:hypothetical protein